MNSLDYIKKLYHDNDVCMASLLSTTQVGDVECDMTLEEAHDLYEEAMKWAGEDDEQD